MILVVMVIVGVWTRQAWPIAAWAAGFAALGFALVIAQGGSEAAGLAQALMRGGGALLVGLVTWGLKLGLRRLRRQSVAA